MIQLPSIFSSGSLYQQNAVLGLRGTADGRVHAELRLADDRIFSSGEADVTDGGQFSLEIKTPSASLDPCRILLWEEVNPEEVLVLDDVLIGELWLASGQSNMEMYNESMDDCEAYMAALSGCAIRIYRQNTLINEPFNDQHLSTEMPIEPSDVLRGSWVKIDDLAESRCVSAVGTAFCSKLYQIYKEEGREIPVGFLNSNMGATRIEGWLPLCDIDEDDETAVGSLVRPAPETWNTFGGENFLQTTALYNLKIYPLRGLKLAGVLWYQGESNIGRQGCYQRYKRYLERYYHTYREMFGANDRFHMVLDLLFPYSYGESGECKLTCINQAMAEMARDQREHFTAVPNYDLPPIWGYQPFSHPIHPINKYPLGERMAQAYMKKVTAPTLRDVRQDGQRLLLTFDNLKGELRIAGKRLYGLYIRGEKTEYLEAEGAVIDSETLEVWHPYIPEPKHVAYQCGSMENGGNLYGRDLPVAPFATEDPYTLHIEGKPWLHTERPAAWFCNCPQDTPIDGCLDYFMHPVWQPISESEVCTDTVFFRNIASLRVSGETNRFGAFTRSRRYNRLDLKNYEALRFKIFNAEAVSGEDGFVEAELLFTPEQGNPYIITRRAQRISEPKRGWAEFSIAFGELPEDELERLTLMFDVGTCVYHFVNIDSLVLVPKM